MTLNFSQRPMEKNSKSSNLSFLQTVAAAAKRGKIPKKFQGIFISFYESYKQALESDGLSIEPYDSLFKKFLELSEQQLSTPFSFEPYHERIRAPFDYYRFGNDLLRPLV